VVLEGMQEGELAEVTVLPSMGYGQDVTQGALAEIPPFSVLFYTIRVLWVEQVLLPTRSRHTPLHRVSPSPSLLFAFACLSSVPNISGGSDPSTLLMCF